MPDYTREQLWKLYEKLPEDLKDAVFSEETADNIYGICTRNGIEDERTSEVAKYVGRVLLGVLSPEEFQKILEKEVKLTKEKANKIAQEINRFVFHPVKESLASLYKIEITPVKPPTTPPPAKPLEAKPAPVKEPPPPPEEKPEETDVYREPIE